MAAISDICLKRGGVGCENGRVTGDYQELVDEISALLGAPATLENRDFGLVAFGAHDSDDDTAMDPVRTRSILTRRSTPPSAPGSRGSASPGRPARSASPPPRRPGSSGTASVFRYAIGVWSSVTSGSSTPTPAPPTSS